MSAPLKILMAIPELRHLTREEAARRLAVTLAELDEANTFALVTFADPDPEFPSTRRSDAERAELRERMPLKWREHYKRDRH